MISKAHRALLMVLGLFAALWFSGSSCGKGPVDPPPPEEKDYVIYMGDALLTNRYYAYHTKTGVVDSFTLPYPCYNSGLVASPDGSKLYLNPPGKIVEVSTESLTVTAEHPLSIERDYSIVELAISNDGKYLASCKRDLAIIDLGDYSVVFRDTARHSYPHFANSTSNLYSATRTNDLVSFYHVLECANGFAETTKSFDYGSANKILPDINNEERWYLFLYVGSGVFLFQVYDLSQDSVLFNKTVVPGHGEFVQTPDGSTLFYSQPDSKWMPVGIPACHIGKFDCFALDSIEEINTNTDGSEYFGIVCPVNELCLTPDGRRLIGTNLVRGQILDYDILAQKFIRRFEFCTYVEPISVTCQSIE